VAGRDVARALAFPRVLGTKPFGVASFTAFPHVLGAKPFGVAPFKMVFLKIFELKWANI
jgi:hypothetical protein